MKNALFNLKEYNRLYKESDILYHNYARSCGLSDMAYWILYSIAESDEFFTQRDFCNDWFFAPQTVNSALKDLERKNIIFLESVPGNRKNKLIKPTDNGKKFIEEYISPLIAAECESFASLSHEECERMLCTTKKYIAELKSRITALEVNSPHGAGNSGNEIF